MKHKLINSYQSDELKKDKFNTLEIDLTYDMKKDFILIGWMNQVYAVMGFIFIALLILGLLFLVPSMSRYAPNGAQIFFITLLSVFSIVSFLMMCINLFSSGTSFKLTALLENDALFKLTLEQYAKYLRWCFIFIVVIVTSATIIMIIALLLRLLRG